MTQLSQSAVREFDACELGWKYRTQTPKEELASDPLPAHLYGNTQHSVLEDVFGWAKTSEHRGPMHTPTAIDVMHAALDARCTDASIDGDTKEQMHDAILDYLMTLDHVDGPSILGNEHFLNFATEHGTRVVGFADRIDRRRSGIVIIDYKGGGPRHDPTPEEVAASLQARVYVAAAYHQFKWAQKITFRLEWLGTRKAQEHTWTRMAASFLVAQLSKELDDVAHGMDTAPWLPNVTERCTTCPFKNTICPAHGNDVPDGYYDPRKDLPS